MHLDRRLRSLARTLGWVGLAVGILACAAALTRRPSATMRLEGALRRPPRLPGSAIDDSDLSGTAPARRRVRPYQADPLAPPPPPAAEGPRWSREGSGR